MAVDTKTEEAVLHESDIDGNQAQEDKMNCKYGKYERELINDLKRVYDAVYEWWLSRKPIAWDVEEFLDSPMTNMITEEEQNLAGEIATAEKHKRERCNI